MCFVWVSAFPLPFPPQNSLKERVLPWFLIFEVWSLNMECYYWVRLRLMLLSPFYMAKTAEPWGWKSPLWAFEIWGMARKKIHSFTLQLWGKRQGWIQATVCGESFLSGFFLQDCSKREAVGAETGTVANHRSTGQSYLSGKHIIVGAAQSSLLLQKTKSSRIRQCLCSFGTKQPAKTLLLCYLR